ncbi:aldehyde dehydrogenase family protein, partial [Rhodococcus hoagii]|nr:aldehyde dehydrogenase family protein [Prescottella equi]
MTRELSSSDAAPGSTVEPAAQDAATTFASLDPRTGRTLAEYPVATAADVRAAVERARGAARWWDAQGFRGRRDWLLEFKKAIASDGDDLARVISAETGKPHDDAL